MTKSSALVRKGSQRIAALRGRLDAWRLWLIRNIDGAEGERIRYKYYRTRVRGMGKNVRIDTGVFLYGAEYISIGDNTHIDKNCIIVGSSPNLDLSRRLLKKKLLTSGKVTEGEVRIGRDCHVSQNCMIYGYGGVFIGDNCVMSAGSKVYSLTSMPTNPFDETQVLSIVPYDGPSPTLVGKVVLNKNVWIGLDSLISPGVEIGRNSFVRSKSIVLKSFAENSYIGGDPAVRIRNRFSGKDQE